MNNSVMKIKGTLVDLFTNSLNSVNMIVEDGKISSVEKNSKPIGSPYLLPGFIDSHIHIESSMLPPAEFARLAVIHGTVATISDPHEIANVLGLKGIQYMIDNGKQVPFYFYFGAPSCVPATSYETAGALLGPQEIEELLLKEDIKYLSEMMNYPGVLSNDPIVMKKLAIARFLGKPIDGHAPGLTGEQAEQYISHGILTDHECFTLEEAIDKASKGMKILIREGSAAKNFEALHPLFKLFPKSVMLCSDDFYPNDLVKGHINLLVKRAIQEKKYDLFSVLASACLHPILHYNLDVGLLRPGDSADFIVVDNLHDLNVQRTFIKGQLVAENGKSFISRIATEIPNNFSVNKKEIKLLQLPDQGKAKLRVIEALDGELITKSLDEYVPIQNGFYGSDVEADILKIVVVNRYKDAPLAIGFIKGFGLKKGAIASTIAHDSHNLIAIGVDDESLIQAINHLIDLKGGIAATNGTEIHSLPLPIAGLMSDQDGFHVAHQNEALTDFAKSLGSHLKAPFMTLSFMALLVIPELKMSDKGLFDCKTFNFI